MEPGILGVGSGVLGMEPGVLGVELGVLGVELGVLGVDSDVRSDGDVAGNEEWEGCLVTLMIAPERNSDEQDLH